MPDDLIISGGGSTVVASDAILARLDDLASLGTLLYSAAAELSLLGSASLSLGMRAAAAQAVSAATSLHCARDRVEHSSASSTRSAHESHELGAKLRVALAAYGEAESIAETAARSVKSAEAWVLGRLTGTLALPFLAVGGLLELVGSLATGMSPAEQAAAAGREFKDHPGLVTGVGAVAGVRDAADGGDDFLAGVLALPPGLVGLVEWATGHSGTALAAGAIAAMAASFGLLGETGVSVRRASSSEGAIPPATLRERFDRIPHADKEPHGEQIRIDRYTSSTGEHSYEVYVGGTADFNPKAGSQPFDMTSNIAGVAGLSPASMRAVEAAMHDAGVTAHTPVQLTGYSQGGLIVSLLAASKQYDVRNVVTFGAPSATIPVPSGVPTLAIRNAEDIVPATSGYDVDRNAVVVERRLFNDEPIPTDLPVPAHQPPFYEQTASLVDQARSSELVALRQSIDDFGSGATSVQTTTWVARRH